MAFHNKKRSLLLHTGLYNKVRQLTASLLLAIRAKLGQLISEPCLTTSNFDCALKSDRIRIEIEFTAHIPGRFDLQSIKPELLGGQQSGGKTQTRIVHRSEHHQIIAIK